MKYIKFTLLVLLLNTCAWTLNAQITANWTLTGPIKFPTNKSGQVNGMGRVSQVVFHPTDPKKMYAASASGGLFISTDGGVNWLVTPGSDKLPNTACASVCVDYTNDQVIYLGGGDANYYSAKFGMYKSTDGGATYTLSNTGIGNRMAIDILMDPSNNKTLIAATNDGIWKTTDAGATWTVKKSGGDFKNMKFNSGDPKTIYAVTSTDFFRSTDLGDTWSMITLPATNSGGGRVGVTKADPNRVYVTFVGNYASSLAAPVYKSTDGGITFTTVKPANKYNLNGYDENQSGQGNYNYGMTVDPLNADNVWICGHCIFRSTDGGTTWTRKTSWAIQMHTDMHQLVYSPYDATKLFNANDGGVWKNSDAGVGVTWVPWCDGMACTENYHAGQSPIKKDRMGAGTQDNGEIYYDAGNWFTNRGGDWGSLTAFDYANINTIYYANDGNRRIGLTGGSQTLSLPFTGSSSTLIEFTPLKTNVAFVTANDIWRTDNLATNPPTWTKISTFNEVIKAIGISPADANIVYAITASGKVFRSDNALSATATFANVSMLATAPSSKASIAVIKSAPNVVYISSNSKVYSSVDKGVTWVSISTGLPATNFIKMYHDIYSSDERVYIANATAGVYYKNKNMAAWINYSQGLPTIAGVRDFLLFNDGNYSNSVLRIAYYGRGVWETPLVNPLSGTTEIISNNNRITVFPNPSKESVTISFSLLQNSNTELALYDMTGKMVKIISGSITLNAGEYNFTVDVSALEHGAYLCKLNADGIISSKILVKE
jgi:trimeric autotransporter adhesin